MALTWENRSCKGENNGNNNNDAAIEVAAAIMAQWVIVSYGVTSH